MSAPQFYADQRVTNALLDDPPLADHLWSRLAQRLDEIKAQHGVTSDAAGTTERQISTFTEDMTTMRLVFTAESSDTPQLRTIYVEGTGTDRDGKVMTIPGDHAVVSYPDFARSEHGTVPMATITATDRFVTIGGMAVPVWAPA